MTAIGRAGARATVSSGQVLAAMAALAVLGGAVAGMLAADAAVLAVAAASALLLATVIVLRPDAATLTTVAVLYSNAAVVAVRIHGVPVAIGAAVPLLLVIPLARDLIFRRQPVVAPPALAWMLVLLALQLLSASLSGEPAVAWESVTIYAIEGVLLFFLLVNAVRTPELLRQVTWVLILAGAAVAGVSILQSVTEAYSNDFWGFAQVSNAAVSTGQATLVGEITQPRITGPIGETNRFAQVMAMLVPLAIYRALAEPRLLLRGLATVCAAAILMAVVLTFSRGAAVGIGALVAALVVLRVVRPRHLALMLLGTVLVFTVFPHYLGRLVTVGEIGGLVAPEGNRAEVGGVILSRATEGLAAALVMVDHPLLGVGPGQFPLFYEEYAADVGLRIHHGAARESHNLYLGLGAELGILGLGVFLIIAAVTLRSLFRAYRATHRRRPDLERLVTPFGLALLVYYVTGMFLHLSFARFYWMMLALATAAAIIALREVRADDAAAERGEGRGPAIRDRTASP